MIEIQLEANNQLLKRIDKEIIVNKSRNIIKAKFTITGDVWDDVDKFAIFIDAFDNKKTVHLGRNSICECVVPASCLETNYFKITVYGGNLIVTNAITIPLRDSGYSRKHQDCDVDLGKDIFVEIFDSLQSKIDDIIFADNCLHLFSNGRLIESISLPFVDEVQIRSMINERIQELLSDELNDYLKQEGYINKVMLVGDELIFE